MMTTSTQFSQSLFHISDDPEESYLSPANKKNLEKLIHGIKETKKLFLVTGKDGSGKATLIQRAVFELGSKTRLLTVNNGSLSYEELIDYIGKDLETGFSSDASLLIKKLRIKELLQMWSIQRVVIHIDQSLNIQQKMLEDVFKLIDDEICDSCFFHLIITGSPERVKVLKKYSLPDSALGDACSIGVERLTADEVIVYINFHLQGLKDRGKSLFSDEALKSIVHYSKGLPRLINRLCNLGLLTAKLEEKPTVTSEMIEEVLENSLLLGNECGFVTSSLKEEELLSKEFAIPDKELFASNSVMNQERLEQEARAEKQVEDYQESGSEYSKANTDSVRKSTRSSTRKISDKKSKSANFGFSNKTVFISAFVMGIIFSVLIGAGMYFLQQSNPKVSVQQASLAGTSHFQAEKNLKQQKVAVLLKRAEQQFAKLQLMKPEKNNAWETYQEVLALIPHYPKALAGIAKIKETYVFWARQEIQRKNYQQAGYYYRKVLEASPDDQNIMEALRGINLKQNPKKILNAPIAKIALTDEEKQQIKALLLQAKQQLANKKLMTPVKDSAWATYKKILALNPDHQQALSGINKIKEIYISWARYEIDKGNKQHATFLFRKGLEISPDDGEILSALANIQAIETTSSWDNNALSRGEYHKLLNDPKGINELLTFAEQQIARKRLTRPVRDSAFTIYKVILGHFPTHKKALAGVKQIKDLYALWAKHEINQGNYRHAEFLYGKALRVAPEDHGILMALSQTKTLSQIKKKLSRKNQE